MDLHVMRDFITSLALYIWSTWFIDQYCWYAHLRKVLLKFSVGSNPTNMSPFLSNKYFLFLFLRFNVVVFIISAAHHFHATYWRLRFLLKVKIVPLIRYWAHSFVHFEDNKSAIVIFNCCYILYQKNKIKTCCHIVHSDGSNCMSSVMTVPIMYWQKEMMAYHFSCAFVANSKGQESKSGDPWESR